MCLFLQYPLTQAQCLVFIRFWVQKPTCTCVQSTFFCHVAHSPSAFTYCEDELPSRLDLGKEKYGGPFTTEQVEDVDVFLGILKVLLSLGPLLLRDQLATIVVLGSAELTCKGV